MENTTRFVAFLGSLHNPPIRGGDLRGDYALVVGRARGGAALMQGQHLLDR